MATDSKKAVETYKEDSKKETERLVRDVFPQKVHELNKLIESDEYSSKRIPEIHSGLNIPVPDPILLNHLAEDEMPHSKKRKLDNLAHHITGTKVMALPNGIVTLNGELKRLSEKLKPHIMDLMDHANKVKMWITFLIPRIEDGNNFGVSIQEDTLAEARQVESEAATFLDQITRYYIQRGKLVARVAKYPHVEDYRQSVVELDEKVFITLRLILVELRNQYASLHDIISKNMDKIKKPRSANAVNMY